MPYLCRWRGDAAQGLERWRGDAAQRLEWRVVENLEKMKERAEIGMFEMGRGNGSLSRDFGTVETGE